MSSKSFRPEGTSRKLSWYVLVLRDLHRKHVGVQGMLGVRLCLSADNCCYTVCYVHARTHDAHILWHKRRRMVCALCGAQTCARCQCKLSGNDARLYITTLDGASPHNGRAVQRYSSGRMLAWLCSFVMPVCKEGITAAHT